MADKMPDQMNKSILQGLLEEAGLVGKETGEPHKTAASSIQYSPETGESKPHVTASSSISHTPKGERGR